MRHRKKTAKLGRTSEHRNMMLANLVCSLIKHRRVTTTWAKAKAARPVAEKMLTLGKSGSIHHRRLAAARLHQEDAVRILFNEIAPTQKDRHGGYTRIIKLHERKGDAAQLAILEWVDEAAAHEEGAEDSAVKQEAVSPAKKQAPSKPAPPAESASDDSSQTPTEESQPTSETPVEKATSENDQEEGDSK
jgi:large subunit ribosomal protein L17